MIHLFLLFSQVFVERQNLLINISKPLQCSCFRTSIWDETLYKVIISINVHKQKNSRRSSFFRHGHKLFINQYQMSKDQKRHWLILPILSMLMKFFSLKKLLFQQEDINFVLSLSISEIHVRFLSLGNFSLYP